MTLVPLLHSAAPRDWVFEHPTRVEGPIWSSLLFLDGVSLQQWQNVLVNG